MALKSLWVMPGLHQDIFWCLSHSGFILIRKRGQSDPLIRLTFTKQIINGSRRLKKRKCIKGGCCFQTWKWKLFQWPKGGDIIGGEKIFGSIKAFGKTGFNSHHCDLSKHFPVIFRPFITFSTEFWSPRVTKKDYPLMVTNESFHSLIHPLFVKFDFRTPRCLENSQLEA